MRIPILSPIIRRIEFKLKGIKVWRPVNIYDSARIGKGVSIGMFSEIGENVEIGNNTRIGANCFVPEGVKIGKNCFIGPHTVFSNDRYPPSARGDWEETIIEDGVCIGAGVCVLPGITIKQRSLIGMGTVLTKHVMTEDIIAGNPGKSIRKRFKPEVISY